MMKGGLISQAPASTPIAAPFFFVWKKDSTRQPVIDYHKLNDITVKDSYPLPCINETLEHMQGAKFFSKFNLKMGYNQLCIKPEDCWKTTFMMPDGPYMMNVMTFGFANTPAYFQQWMSDILQPVVGQHVENYLDDTATHHTTHGQTCDNQSHGVEMLSRCWCISILRNANAIRSKWVFLEWKFWQKDLRWKS